ncbi:phosphocholine cytidylyltransferase family protein [Oribacterium sp. FC2011]|uniref:phosphocholine cytidylyltransferase family protein n=1 Tax=Oribacterium sp. FC2011 TaxID=1408311 RepID=UPI000A818050|nr:sugar phosphate nucleotidyltransferase [Oribacterium sp. FC2011]
MMTYIILAAGKGINLQPLTLKYAKTSYKLDESTTVLQRMVRSIRKSDKNAEIVVVVGYKSEEIKKELDGENVKFIMNPFYEVTNSISSVWFARDYLERENVAIVHGDVVFSDEIIRAYLTVPTDHPYVLVDSSYIRPGAYNTVTQGDQVLVMSKKLENFTAKYCCMTKLDPVSSRLLKGEIDSMINSNMYDQFFEDSLVQMIMFHDFQLFCEDIAGKKWSEVDTVDDLLTAQEIHRGK